MSRKGGVDRGIFIWPGQLKPGEDVEKAKKSRKLVYGIRYVDGTGKERKEKAGSYATAKSLYAKRKTEVLDGRHRPRAQQITVSQAVQRYLDVSEQNKSRDDDLWHAEVVNNAFGKLLVDQLDAHAIETWMQRRAGEASNSTANRHLGFLKRCTKKALRDRLASMDPTDSVRSLPEPPGRERYLTTDELEALRKAMEPEDWMHVELAINTGFRLEEQFQLKKQQLDFNAGPPSRAGRPVGFIYVRVTKSGKPKPMPMNAISRRILEAAVKASKHPVWVFPSSAGTAMNAKNFTRRQFRPALAAAGIEDFRWHDLRHCFGSYLRMRGVPLGVIAKLLGHSSQRMSERYAHLGDEQLVQAVEILEADQSERLQLVRAIGRTWHGHLQTWCQAFRSENDVSENNRKRSKKAPLLEGPSGA